MMTPQGARVFVDSNGLLKFVYSDELQPLLELGHHSINRASNVEPAPEGWLADLAILNGPTLGPFPLRREAISAEVQHLEHNLAVL